ncbi:Vegetative incompatibility protein [Wickerhamomyces ciferrii]|uniref:Vegetative incompatibility protein n=1 Tax=Wickerhamomyces ciferrii (strain ATCC 14091 / BCRC 22168 / CBS 111 / JCM 3599 / NBRC 0793 / NRRL Y-1031 F-60-10) TaxID=1206466 RepID=K0KI13_WICCF|nr:Vegetative incompatibility protein [Wickerhamomyces ciferrii]CCH40773.1 Vegetative incompatibility protein [Wickerhamomyces ciferrii]
MNLALLDPFAVLKEFPETLTHTLNFGHSVYIKYNNSGDYLASGLSSGTILIIDNDTKNVIRKLQGHIRAIQSLKWSSCGRYLLSSSRDWKCLLWDLKFNKIIKKFNFNGPIWNAEFSSKNISDIVVALYDNTPKIIDETHGIRDLDDDKSLVTTFHPDGEHIFIGTNKGIIKIISRETLEVLFTQKISNSSIKNIVISSNGRKMAINSSDRIIRQITLPEFSTDSSLWELETDHKYQDVVNRLQWNSILFNSNSEYLIASAFGSAHVIYMWETSMGSLVKILEGPKEELVDIEWNFRKCIIGATGIDSGTIYLWTLVIPQKWSALAPDFVEIEENIDYEEKEDEFDIVPEDEINQKQLNEEDELIDIITKDKTDARGYQLDKPFVVDICYDQIELSEGEE